MLELLRILLQGHYKKKLWNQNLVSTLIEFGIPYFHWFTLLNKDKLRKVQLYLEKMRL
jgi:hypothetical protein